jgi:shikimate dehydrogenase
MTNEDLPGAELQLHGAPSPWSCPSVLVGLIGTSIQASRTPSLHEREGAQQGLRYVYKLIDLEAFGLDARALPEILTAAERFGFAGLNITHPCKQAILPLLDELSPDAAALGAVNTVVLKNGRRMGHNTDWWGFAVFSENCPTLGAIVWFSSALAEPALLSLTPF